MEDLRKNYNAKKSEKKKIDWYNLYIANQNLIRLITFIGLGIFIILSPETLGKFLNNWINSFYNALMPIDIERSSWFTFLFSLAIITIIYKIYSYKKSEQ